MRRHALFAGLAALALPASAAASGDEPLLTFCLERTPRDVAAAAVLDGWMSAVRIEVSGPPCAPPREAEFVGRFELRGSSVYFRLAGATGPALGRALPWLDGLEEPLASLDTAGWLGEFSVVLEALLAEHHLALEWAEILEAELAQAGGAGGPNDGAASTVGGGTGAGKASGVRGGKSAGKTSRVRGGKSTGKASGVREGKSSGQPTGVQGAKSAGKPSGVRAGTSAGEADAAGSQAPGSATSGGADAGGMPAGGGGTARAHPSDAAGNEGGATAAGSSPDLATAGATSGGSGPEDPGAGAPAGDAGASAAFAGANPGGDVADDEMSEAPRLPGIEEEARTEAARLAAAREARRNAIDFRAPDGDPVSLGLQAGGALRLRSPDVAAPELSVGFEVGSIYARAAWQPQVRWQLSDLAIGVEALGGEAGLHFPLLSGRIWSIRGNAGVTVERLVLTPLYREGAAEQVGWDAGPTAGANLGLRVGPDLHVGFAGGLHWMPTARLTHIGSLGPSARVNSFGGRLGMDFSWRR